MGSSRFRIQIQRQKVIDLEKVLWSIEPNLKVANFEQGTFPMLVSGTEPTIASIQTERLPIEAGD